MTRVLELVDPSAEYAGRLLAGLGFDVVKLEPPEGAPSRCVGPYIGDEPDIECSLAFWADNVGKRSVVVDDDETIRRLVTGADVLLHTMRPVEAAGRGLSADALLAANPRLVVCAVTPFGADGPWADFVADDLVLMALGGSMAACGYPPNREGEYDTPPLACHGDQAYRTASTYAVIAILAALHWREDSGAGQSIDVSIHECSASMTEWHLINFFCTGEPYQRGAGALLVDCRDGTQVTALMPDFLGPHVFTNLLALLTADGIEGPLSDPEYADPRFRMKNYREITRALRRLGEKHDGEEMFRLGQESGLPWGVIRAPEETLADRHLRARGHFVAVDRPDGAGSVEVPGAPFLASASPFQFERGAPRLGEHTHEVLAELHGGTPSP
jgi:crotonobetainyl-CoA:carnitine CoA-transferase CaiB-like acyl-CoA transferase